MNSENTENTQTIDQVIEEITQNTETKNTENTEPVNVPIKKPRKPLTEESKMKRRETLQKARQAKLDKLKAPKPVVEKPIEKPVEKKSEYEKYMKKIDKEIMIEKLVDEKFRKDVEYYNDPSELNTYAKKCGRYIYKECDKKFKN